MKILLICTAGMSTSAIVRKMEESAAAQNIEAEIWAVGEAKALDNVGLADVIMLGPQIRFALNRIQEMVPNTPVAVIDMVTYGRMDGNKILADAVAMAK